MVHGNALARQGGDMRGPALASLAVLAAAAGLEGGTLPAWGGACIVAMCAIAGFVVVRRGVEAPPRLARLGLALVAVTLLWQLLPIPNALRHLVAPGQARWKIGRASCRERWEG